MLRIRGKKNAQGVELIPLFGDELATAATVALKSVAGDGNQRREVASDEETIQRPEATE